LTSRSGSSDQMLKDGYYYRILVDLHVLSYNWMVTSLHEEVGFKVLEQILLNNQERDGFLFHDIVSLEESNVKYSYTKMLLIKDDFYKLATWL